MSSVRHPDTTDDNLLTHVMRGAHARSRATTGGIARVVIAGGGPAGLEAVLALRALAADVTDITLVAPEHTFVNPAMAVCQPFGRQRVRGLRYADLADRLGVRFHRGMLDRVEPVTQHVITRDRVRLPYDVLLLAIGARTVEQCDTPGLLSFTGQRSSSSFRLLLHQLRERRIRKVAFVEPPGLTWPLPLYDLALMTAAECTEHHLADIELSIVTPEEDPLDVFGTSISRSVRGLLSDARITLLTGSGVHAAGSPLPCPPDPRLLAVDRVVTVPRLLGPRLRGIACGPDGFVPLDRHGRVAGLEGVFAAGDATEFPIKHGGLAAQQADAAAEAIAASIGVDVVPRPFTPVLHGVLTGDRPRFLLAEIGDAGGRSVISCDPLWWPTTKLYGRYLGPFLDSQRGDARDVIDLHALTGPRGVDMASEAASSPGSPG